MSKYNEAAVVAAALLLSTPALAQQARAPRAPAAAPTPAPAAAASAPSLRPCESVTVDPPTELTLGKSRVVQLPFPASRMIVGGRPAGAAGAPLTITPTPGRQRDDEMNRTPVWDGVAETDITLLSPTELYFLGRRPGSMNVVLQAADGRCLVKDIVVTIDPSTIQNKLVELMPQEQGIQVRSAENAIVLTGTVSDAIHLDQAVSIASSYGDGKKVVNLLRVTAPQQVMLEVKIAEVSKSVMDNLNIDFARAVASADGTVAKFFSGLLGGGPILASRMTGLTNGQVSGLTRSAAGNTAITGPINQTFDAFGRPQLSPIAGASATAAAVQIQKRDGIVRVLAEPNIMAISGQSASFLSGGKIFIPVSQNRGADGGSVITLEEKEFGVGLKFTPTVLDGTRINLKLVSEASDLSQSGSPFTTTNGETAILPSMSTRRVDTTVQLNDGQSFIVAGLIKNNMNEAISKFPGLGDIPVLGALFRSTEFQTNQTELMFVVTPHLVKPLASVVALPTDSHIAPTRNSVMLMGAGEGSAPPPPAPGTRAQTQQQPVVQSAPVRAGVVEVAPMQGAGAQGAAPQAAPAQVPAQAAPMEIAPLPVIAPQPEPKVQPITTAPVDTAPLHASPSNTDQHQPSTNDEDDNDDDEDEDNATAVRLAPVTSAVVQNAALEDAAPLRR